MGWGRNEPELRSLYEWIDIQQRDSGGKRAAILGGTIGAATGLCGGSIAVLIGVFGVHPALAITIPVLLLLLICGAMLAWFFMGRTPQEKVLAQTVGEMRNTFWKLVAGRWQGNLADRFGTAAIQALNSGAYECLRCRAALRSPGWTSVQASSAYGRARAAASVSMETAMARLVVMVGHGAPPDSAPVQELLAEMKAAAEEAVATSNRLARHRDLPADATSDLRRALGEMRALNEADDEYTEVIEGRGVVE